MRNSGTIVAFWLIHFQVKKNLKQILVYRFEQRFGLFNFKDFCLTEHGQCVNWKLFVFCDYLKFFVIASFYRRGETDVRPIN